MTYGVGDFWTADDANGLAMIGSVSNGSQPIPNASNTLVGFSAVSRDSNSSWDAANSQWVIGEAGFYNITFHGEWATGATGYRQITLQLNGTAVAVSAVPGLVTANPSVDMSLGKAFAAGGALRVLAQQTSGGALNLLIANFTINRIGN